MSSKKWVIGLFIVLLIIIIGICIFAFTGNPKEVFEGTLVQQMNQLIDSCMA